MTEHYKSGQELRGAGLNQAPVGSRVGAAWIRVTNNLAAEGGRTVSQSDETNAGPYERATAAVGIDPGDAEGYVVALSENVLEVAKLSPDAFPAITGAIWGALLTGIEVARSD